MDQRTFALKYLRSFRLFKRTARAEFTTALQSAKWRGLLDGVSARTERNGLADPVLRVAVNLLGAPPLKGKAFAAYRTELEQDTVVGAGLAVHLPLGNYEDDKLLNLGNNRFTIRPQIGIVHEWRKWSAEVTGSLWVYSRNDDFFRGHELDQSPFFTAQAHLVHTFRPGLWIAAGIGYGEGGQSTIDGTHKNDRKGALAYDIILGYPITRKLGLKVAYTAYRTQKMVGVDSDTVAMAVSVLW
jgi:hypothetical protein